MKLYYIQPFVVTTSLLSFQCNGLSRCLKGHRNLLKLLCTITCCNGNEFCGSNLCQVALLYPNFFMLISMNFESPVGDVKIEDLHVFKTIIIIMTILHVHGNLSHVKTVKPVLTCCFQTAG